MIKPNDLYKISCVQKVISQFGRKNGVLKFWIFMHESFMAFILMIGYFQ